MAKTKETKQTAPVRVPNPYKNYLLGYIMNGSNNTLDPFTQMSYGNKTDEELFAFALGLRHARHGLIPLTKKELEAKV